MEWGDFADVDEPDEPPPTFAERLLYALGQLYRLHHRGELKVAPVDFDILDLAHIIGVSKDIDLVSEEPHATGYHFAGEVLVMNPAERFPWRLMNLELWAAWCEFEEHAREFGVD